MLLDSLHVCLGSDYVFQHTKDHEDHYKPKSKPKAISHVYMYILAITREETRQS